MRLNSFNIKKWVLSIALVILATLIFHSNILGSVKSDFFNYFQKDSEALIVGAIAADKLNLDKKHWGIGNLAKDGKYVYPDNMMDANEIIAGSATASNPVFHPYPSQVGIQANFYSFIQRLFNPKDISSIHYIPSLIMGLLVIVLFFLNKNIYGIKYAIIFSGTLLLSPWVVSFARNLYWSPFLWFLPLLFSTIAFSTKSVATKNLCYLFVFLSFLLKSLSGYEYITSITLLACSPFIVAPFFQGEEKPQWRPALVIFGLCVLGFTVALLIHANLRGDNIPEGLLKIFNEDVKRRTYGDAAQFDPIFRESLTTSPITVILTYITVWTTPLVGAIPGSLFQFIFLLCVIELALSKWHKQSHFNRDFILLTYMSMIPLSWFFMAKAHSHIHTHMNYVLWYLGFVPALFFISYNLLIRLTNPILNLTAKISRRVKIIFASVFIIFMGGREIYYTIIVSQQTNKYLATLVKLITSYSPDLSISYEPSSNNLVFSSHDCNLITANRFAVHAIPSNIYHLPKSRLLYGFVDYNFDMEDTRRGVLEYLLLPNSVCFKKIEIGNYPVKGFRIGQYSDKNNFLWGGFLSLENKTLKSSFSSAKFSNNHSNDTNKKLNPFILIDNSFENRQSITAGDTLQFDGNDNRVVKELVYSSDYIKIFIDSEDLPTHKNGDSLSFRIIR